MARQYLAYVVFIGGVIVLAVVALVVIDSDSSPDKDRAFQIFTMLLPVIASWIGTILAFYFGRQNFESANNQVRQLVQGISPDSEAELAVNVMRDITVTTHISLQTGQDPLALTLDLLSDKYTQDIHRLPILDHNDHPLLMIHKSSVDSYIALDPANNGLTNTVGDLIAAVGDNFGPNVGFVTVSRTATLEQAKSSLEAVSTAKDIFVTNKGTATEPAFGWLSNGRLMRELQSG